MNGRFHSKRKRIRAFTVKYGQRVFVRQMITMIMDYVTRYSWVYMLASCLLQVNVKATITLLLIVFPTIERLKMTGLSSVGVVSAFEGIGRSTTKLCACLAS